MQYCLFPDSLGVTHEIPKAVNVASVPQRSPFRYPGGKTWFVPTLRKWLRSRPGKPALLIEPFAGGGTISLTAAFEGLTERVLMDELDEQVAAVWQTIVEGHAKWLAEKILNFYLNRENLSAELNKKHNDIKHIAFQTILKNRTLHGGILAEGSGFIKHGENGKGLLSRWYPLTLAKRIESIDLIIQKINFMRVDGLEIMRSYASREDVVFFIDPPYTAGGKKAGARLYKYSDINHEALFKICKFLKGDFVITYDNAEEVKNLARQYGFEMKPIAMKNTHNAEMTELVIGKDLSWMDDTPQIRERKTIYGLSVKTRRKPGKQQQ
jgi:DNA adenine methylase